MIASAVASMEVVDFVVDGWTLSSGGSDAYRKSPRHSSSSETDEGTFASPCSSSVLKQREHDHYLVSIFFHLKKVKSRNIFKISPNIQKLVKKNIFFTRHIFCSAWFISIALGSFKLTLVYYLKWTITNRRSSRLLSSCYCETHCDAVLYWV